MGLRHSLLIRDFKLSPHPLLSFHQCGQTILVLARHKMLAITMIIVLTLIMARPLYICHQYLHLSQRHLQAVNNPLDSLSLSSTENISRSFKRKNEK